MAAVAPAAEAAPVGRAPVGVAPARVQAMSENGSAGNHDELYLIDGSSLAYRAFFALPESIATSTGVPTNAIFGFASRLVKLLPEPAQRPGVGVGDGGPPGRKEISPE